jgi:hypothetical protein
MALAYGKALDHPDFRLKHLSRKAWIGAQKQSVSHDLIGISQPPLHPHGLRATLLELNNGRLPHEVASEQHSVANQIPMLERGWISAQNRNTAIPVELFVGIEQGCQKPFVDETGAASNEDALPFLIRQ